MTRQATSLCQRHTVETLLLNFLGAWPLCELPNCQILNYFSAAKAIVKWAKPIFSSK